MSVNKSRLRNLGNTCYINSVLHCLLHCPGGFNEFILSGDYIESLRKNYSDDEDCYKTLIFQYHRILNFIFKFENKEVGVKSWKYILSEKNEMFDGYRQHDAQEFLSYVLDAFMEEIGNEINIMGKNYREVSDLSLSDKVLNMKSDISWCRYFKRKYSLLIPMFYGQFRTELIFNDSGGVSNRFSPFNILQLSLKGDGEISLDDCLENYLKYEDMDSDNMVSSDMSYGLSCVRKRESIWKLPKYMMIQLKRFEYNMYGEMTRKDDRLVKYGMNIDMSKYIDERSIYSRLNNRYKLFGVVMHYGRVGFGHYVCMLRNRTNGRWYLYNDESMPECIRESEIESKVLNNENGYILMYSRIE